jgi:hypothetical protein
MPGILKRQDHLTPLHPSINGLDFFWPNRHLGSNLRRPTHDRRLHMFLLPWPTEHSGAAQWSRRAIFLLPLSKPAARPEGPMVHNGGEKC